MPDARGGQHAWDWPTERAGSLGYLPQRRRFESIEWDSRSQDSKLAGELLSWRCCWPLAPGRVHLRSSGALASSRSAMLMFGR